MGGGGGSRHSFCCVGNCCIGQCCIMDNKLGDWLFKRNKGSTSGGNTDSIDLSNLELTIKVQETLTEFSTETRERSTQLENDIIKESRENLDEFLKELRKYNKISYGHKKLNINLDYIERENRKTEDTIHGFIVKKISKRISTGDEECYEILKMNAGEEKTKALDEFYKKVLKEAILELTEILRTAMKKQTDIVEERIQHRIDNIMDTCENKAEEFERIQQIKESGEDEMEQEQMRLSYFVAMCEYGLATLE